DQELAKQRLGRKNEFTKPDHRVTWTAPVATVLFIQPMRTHRVAQPCDTFRFDFNAVLMPPPAAHLVRARSVGRDRRDDSQGIRRPLRVRDRAAWSEKPIRR